MTCRLCLKELQEIYSVSLFTNCPEKNQAEILKFINKFFYLKLVPDDHISTFICQNCFKQLDDFIQFWKYVKKQQESLQQRTEFFEIKCVESDGSHVNLPALNKDDNVLVQVKTECDVSVVDVLKEVDEPASITDIENLKIEHFESDEDEPDNIALTSSDDDIPLQDLKDESFKKKTKRKTYKQLNAKDDIQNRSEDLTISNSIELSCELCKENIGNFDELILHFAEKHTEEKAFIRCCGKTITQKNKLLRHLNWHRNPEMFKCKICNRVLSSLSSLEGHVATKHKEKNQCELRCSSCGKTFSSLKRFENHTNCSGKWQKQQLSCQFCNKSYTSEHRLKRHFQGLHGTVYPYKCSACNEPFNFKADLDSHSDNCRSKLLLNRIQLEEKLDGETVCKICHRIFSNPKQLNRHITSIHENISPFVCDQCGKKFKFKPAFQKHLQKHSGIEEPPVQCELCGNWLKNKQSLRLHIYRHSESFSECHLCGRKCPSRRALKGHIQNVHRNEKEYKCKHCDKSFKSSKNLEEHIATHTGAQLYNCPHCPKETRSSSNMYMHIKRMHVEEWLKSKIARSNNPNLNTEKK